MRRMVFAVAVVMVVGMVAQTALAGNGAPSGPHFNLNLIGVKDGQEKDMDNCGQGRRIFVKLGAASKKEVTKINLIEAPDDVTFEVVDCDGTDDGEATFMLPNPAPDTPKNCTRYSVWIRPLGSPKGEPEGEMQTCATECLERNADGDCISFGDLVCSTEYVTLKRTKGQQTFQDVSRELLTICVWVCVEYDPDTGACLEWELQRRYLFDPMFEDYYWKYTNGGVKLVQLRFYLEEQCYSDTDWKCRNMTNTPHP